jgi:DNA-directed RNA polymerase specialized sigma24 family protein
MAEWMESRRKRFDAEARKLPTRQRLTSLALSLMREPAAANDLMQSAILAAYDPAGASPWDPDGAISFVRHVGNLMIGMAYNDRRRFFARRVALDGEITIDGQVAGDAPPADEEVDAARLFAQAQTFHAALWAAVEKGDRLAAGVYQLLREGVEGNAAIAARLGCSADEVALAIKRLIYHGRRIADEEQQKALHEMKQRQTAHAARTPAGASE